MPPSGFNRKTVKGLLMFTEGCYEDLQKEVASGKHPDIKTAIRYEQRQLAKAIGSLHINEQGRLVLRSARKR